MHCILFCYCIALMRTRNSFPHLHAIIKPKPRNTSYPTHSKNISLHMLS